MEKNCFMAKNQQIPGFWTWLGVVGFIMLILGCIAMIYPARLQYARQLEFHERVQAEAAKKRAEREALQREVMALENSPAAIERIARENFRLCRDGEVIMYYEKPDRND